MTEPNKPTPETLQHVKQELMAYRDQAQRLLAEKETEAADAVIAAMLAGNVSVVLREYIDGLVSLRVEAELLSRAADRAGVANG